MLIASKYEEIYAPEVGDFVYITDNAYSSETIRSMEWNTLKALDYQPQQPSLQHTKAYRSGLALGLGGTVGTLGGGICDLVTRPIGGCGSERGFTYKEFYLWPFPSLCFAFLDEGYLPGVLPLHSCQPLY